MNATRYLPFAGRLLIGLPFALSGLGKLGAYGLTTQMIGAVGLPLPPPPETSFNLSRSSATRARMASALRAKSVDETSRLDWILILPLPDRSRSHRCERFVTFEIDAI